MARILSQVITVGRGSVGGLTFTANQFHPIIIRAKTSPVNPGTLRQTKVRSQFAAASTLWGSLDGGDRDGWIEYADGLDFSGPLGNYKVPGRQVFISNIGTALYLHDTGFLSEPPVTTPPEIPGFLGVQDLNVQEPSGVGTGFEIAFKNINEDDVLGFAARSRAFLPSRLRYKGPWLTNIPAADAAVSQASGEISFLELVADSIYFARFRLITQVAPYRLSAEFFVRAVAITIEA